MTTIAVPNKSFSIQSDQQIREIYKFVKPYFSKFPEQEIIEIITRHWLYGTIDAVYKRDKIVAVVRWNVSESGRIFEVLDLVIKKGENGFRIMKHLIARNWSRFPSAQYISFARRHKYADRKARLYKISKILKIRSL